MKRLCFVEYDMTVIGGVEQVTTSLANAFCDEYEVYIYMVFLEKGKMYRMIWIREFIIGLNWQKTAEFESELQVYLNHLKIISKRIK